ncbi:hypothetical protein SAMN02910317_02730 [Ruminococcaceae bacterium FB2012]|nr:hypothetical protein SAMN02910317_02730 [Ruminococcaceae bacterium FB2012]
MKTKRILTLLCAGVMLAGCAGTPDAGSAENGDGLGYITLAELPEDIEAAKSASYKTFILDEHIWVNIPEKISEMNIKGRKPDAELAQKFIDHYGLTDKIKGGFDTDPHSEYLVYYREGGESADLLFYISKLCSFNYCTEKLKAPDPGAAAAAKTRRLYTDRLTDGDTLTIDGRVVNAKALIAQATEYINDFAAVVGAYENVPMYIDYGDYDTWVYFTRIEHGYYQPFCEADISDDYDKIDPKQEDFIVSGEQCRVLYRSSDKPAGIYESAWQTSAEYIGEECDKMISLSSALKYLDDSLAEYLECDMDNISIIQLKKDHTMREVSDIGELDFNSMELDIDTHHYWQFVMHSKGCEDDRYAALIDCTTGKFSFSKIF